MTEQEWLGCDKPHPMLTFLRGRVSNRKLRLYACASCRRVWPLLQDGRSRKAVEPTEVSRAVEMISVTAQMLSRPQSPGTWACWP